MRVRCMTTLLGRARVCEKPRCTLPLEVRSDLSGDSEIVPERAERLRIIIAAWPEHVPMVGPTSRAVASEPQAIREVLNIELRDRQILPVVPRLSVGARSRDLNDEAAARSVELDSQVVDAVR